MGRLVRGPAVWVVLVGIGLVVGEGVAAERLGDGVVRDRAAHGRTVSAAVRYESCPLDPRLAAMWLAGRISPAVEEDLSARDSVAIRRQIGRLEGACRATAPRYGGRMKALRRRMSALRLRLALTQWPEGADAERVMLASADRSVSDLLGPRGLPSVGGIRLALGGSWMSRQEALRIAGWHGRARTYREPSGSVASAAGLCATVRVGESVSLDQEVSLICGSDGPGVFDEMMVAMARAKAAAGSNRLLARRRLGPALALVREARPEFTSAQWDRVRMALREIQEELGRRDRAPATVLTLFDQGHYGDRQDFSFVQRETARRLALPSELSLVREARGSQVGLRGVRNRDFLSNNLIVKRTPPDKSGRRR